MLHTPRRPGPVPGWSLRATMVLEQEDGRCLARGAEPRGAWGAWGARGAGRLASSVRAILFTAVSIAPAPVPELLGWLAASQKCGGGAGAQRSPSGGFGETGEWPRLLRQLCASARQLSHWL